MITTPQKVLDACSRSLNEGTTDVTAKRIGIFNDAMHHVLAQYKWEWARKYHALNADDGETTFVLSTEITDYDITWGIHQVDFTDRMFPVFYEDRATFHSERFTLTPDKKQIIFTKAFTGNGNTVGIWYYAEHTDVTAAGTTLSVPIPEAYLNLVAKYMKYLVHDGKRQRNDARNAILDFQEILEQSTMKNASQKAKDLPMVMRSPLAYAGFRRTYASH